MHTNPIPAIALSILMALGAGTPLTMAAGDGISAAGVKPGAGRAHVREALLRKRVRTQLLKHIKAPDALRIQVSTKEQTVTLTGEVEKQSNLKLAGTLARSAVGVRQVNNMLTVAIPDKSKLVAVTTVAAKKSVRKTRVKTRQVAQAGLPPPTLEPATHKSAGGYSSGVTESVQPVTPQAITPVTASPASGEGKAGLDEHALASGDTAVTPE